MTNPELWSVKTINFDFLHEGLFLGTIKLEDTGYIKLKTANGYDLIPLSTVLLVMVEEVPVDRLEIENG